MLITQHVNEKNYKKSRPIDLVYSSPVKSHHSDHCTADCFNSIRGKVISGLDNSVDRFGLYWNSAMDNTTWDYETERLMSFPVFRQTRKAECRLLQEILVDLSRQYY